MWGIWWFCIWGGLFMFDEYMKMKIRGYFGGFYGLIFWVWYEV